MDKSGSMQNDEWPTAMEAAVITKSMLDQVAKIDKSQGFQHHDPAIPSHKRSSSPKRAESPDSSRTFSGGMRSPNTPLSQQSSARMVLGHGEEVVGKEDDDVVMEDPKSELVTRIGRYRAWHPEDSVVKELPGYRVPGVEELEDLYKMPVRRLRKREDGIGGATLWQPAELVPPVGVEEAIRKNFGLKKQEPITVSLPHLGEWRDILRDQMDVARDREKAKTSLKRSLR